MQFTATAKLGYQHLFDSMVVRPEYESSARQVATRIIAGRARYEKVSAVTGVPWWFVGIVHMRESNGDFQTHLHNGDPLTARTVHVPAGRPIAAPAAGEGHPYAWEESAIDALRIQNLHNNQDWSVPSALYHLEKFNGFGYVKAGINSPYLWSWSNLYTAGKYVADGEFSASAVDAQPGGAVMLRALIWIIPSLIPELIKEILPVPDTNSNSATVAITPPVTSTGTTLNPGVNLATHAIVALGIVFAGIGWTEGANTLQSIATFGGGVAISIAGFVISHFLVNGSNSNTIAVIDSVLDAYIKAHQSVTLVPVVNVNGQPTVTTTSIADTMPSTGTNVNAAATNAGNSTPS